MKALITGITGFVGYYLEKQLVDQGIEVFGTSRKVNLGKNIYQLDLLDKNKIQNILKEIKPTHVFHLAGESNVKNSWSNPSKTFEINTIGSANLLEAVYKVDNGIRVITIGSSEEYGKVNNLKKITEEMSINPSNPYGISKAAVGMLINQLQKGFGMDVIHLRPFNHIGPSQKQGFVTSDFAYQIALFTKGKLINKQMKVGNLDAVRDFTDVRDIVKAYYLIAIHGRAGEVYNVCSGKGYKIKEILDILLSFTDKTIEIKIDSQNLRPQDSQFFIGDYKKLEKSTNWNPSISLTESLNDIYNYWLNILV
ncbi:GDP-mannose 4,6-dehydratase [Peribacillus frigoritolerans]|uniref:GDP-mannose 4,6-dehydratase n=1 Tax=Peribacillus frigoritolerans TaxID=450367 RepID=UPI003F85891A